jgi:Ca2+-binding RTX toxin-like protein
MPTYYFSDTNQSFSGSGSSDTLTFNNDTGTFDWRNFSFNRYNDDLWIMGNNGHKATVTNHFNNNTNRMESLIIDGDTIDLTAGNLIVMNKIPAGYWDYLYGTSGADLILGGIGKQAYDSNNALLNYASIQAGAGDDIIIANYVGYLNAGDGNDTIYALADTIIAGDGNDTIYISDIETFGGDNAHADGGNDTIYGSSDDNTGLFGDAGNDIIYGYAGEDHLHGGSGDDTIYGGDDDDTILGYDDADTLYGEDGNDLIDTGNGDDIVYGGDGNDTIYGNIGYAPYYTGNKEIYGENGNDVILDGAGNDLLDGGTGNDLFYGDSGGDDTFYGGDGDDEIRSATADGEIDTLYGEDGNDILFFSERYSGYFSQGDAFLYGGTGNDTYRTTNPNNTSDIGSTLIYDGSGSADLLKIYSNPANWSFSVSGSDLIVTLAGHTGNITIDDHFISGHHIESIQFVGYSTISLIETLTSGNDTYTGSSAIGVASNIIYALDGNDTVYAGTGGDMVSGDVGDDTLYGEAGNDTLYGTLGNDTLYGGNDNDVLNGGDNADTLDGGSGTDTLYGDNGFDTLTGGANADTFMFDGDNAFQNVDEITDFTNGGGGDYIDISDVLSDVGYNPGTHTLSDWVATRTSGSDTYIQIDQDGTGGGYGMVDVVKLDGVGSLSLTDLTTNGNLITT